MTNIYYLTVSFKNIRTVPFPAVTVCAPNSGKWPAMVEALDHYDTDGQIFKAADIINNSSRSFSLSFYKAAGQLLLKEFDPKLILDHNLPSKLKLSPIEMEVFYLLHFGFFLKTKTYGYEYPIEYGCEDIIVQSMFRNKTQQEIGEEAKEHICQYLLDEKDISCLSLKNPEWMKCLHNGSISIHQEWCQNCVNLSDCLGPKEDDFLKLIVKIFHGWKKFFTKRNLIDSSMSKFLTETSFGMFDEMGNYFKTIKPFSNSNLTLLDAWAYAKGDVIDTLGPFKEYEDQLPIEALKSCAENQNENSCLLVGKFDKEIRKDNTKMWGSFLENIYNDLIPLCSYASDKLILKNCKVFKKMSNARCFTFNESSFDQRVGNTQGVNFLINYDYPVSTADNNEPVTVILHEPNQQPDIDNIMGKNFYVAPGHIMNLKFSATVIDSTEDFDAMNFKSRLCNEHIEDGEINCYMHRISDHAKSVCGCQPWYTLEEGSQQCDTLGTLCYEKAILNSTKDVNLKDQCYESCKSIKYSLILQDSSLMDTIINLDIYGTDFENYFLKSDRLYHFLDYHYKESNFVKPRLQKSSIIHINYEESKVWTVTKDAKITMPDMIGNIGGTLGVFIGFSFLGLLGTFIEGMQYLWRKINSLRRPKSNLPLMVSHSED